MSYILKNTLIVLLFSVLLFNCEKKNTKLIYSKNNHDSLINLAYSSPNKKVKLNIANRVFSDIGGKKIDTVSRKNLINLAGLFFYLKKEKEYLKICNDLLANPAVPIDHVEVAYINYYLATYNYTKGNYDTSFAQYTKAEKSFRVLNNLQFLCISLNTKAQILLIRNDFVGAETLSIKTLKIGLKAKDYVAIFDSYLSLGMASEGLNNLSKAADYYEKAITINEKFNTNQNYNLNKAITLNYLANICLLQKNYKKAVEYGKKGLAVENFKITIPVVYCYLTNKIGYAQFKLGDKTAFKKFEETLKIGLDIKSDVVQITSKKRLGEYYLASKDSAKAIRFFEDSRTQANKSKIFDDELVNLKLLMKTNPTKEAFYATRYIDLNDSLQKVERTTREKFARLEFETDEITVEKEKFEVKNKLLSKTLLVILAFAILVAFLVILIFKNRNQKAESEALFLKQEQQIANATVYQLMLEQQDEIEGAKNKEKERISLDLHDGVMGKLTAVRLNLYNAKNHEAVQKNEVIATQIKEVKAVEVEIRNISHDLQQQVFNQKTNFIALVKNLVADSESNSKTVFTVEVDDDLRIEQTSYNVQINLYRIIQEALQNIKKYAEAKNVTVVFSKNNSNQIVLYISDNGIGFDVGSKKNGIGIKNMKSRVESISGAFKITSELKKGTKIQLSIPI